MTVLLMVIYYWGHFDNRNNQFPHLLGPLPHTWLDFSFFLFSFFLAGGGVTSLHKEAGASVERTR